MKIIGGYIDGFGIFHDQSFSNLENDIVIYYGHNEAGKSTLLGFFRSVLFGFPRANAKDPSYPPIAGGVHGGRLDLKTNTGEIWGVSRKPGKSGGNVQVTGKDDMTYGKPMLDQLLGSVSYETFRNIMAFSLFELQGMETLSGEHITSAIYGAGLGASMAALPSARKKVQDSMERLFRKSGSKPVINQLIGELEGIRKELQSAFLETAQYDSICDALAHTEKELETCREKLNQARQHQQYYGALEQLWPDWVLLQETEKELAVLGPTPDSFPEDGLPLLDRLVEKREVEGRLLADLTDKLKQVSEKCGSLPVEKQVLSQADTIGTLVEKRNTYVENIRRLPLLLKDLRQVNDDIQRILQGLGGHWDETAACDFDRSLFTRESIRGHQERLDITERQIAGAEKILADRKAALDAAETAKLQAERHLKELGPAPVERDGVLVSRLKQGRDRFADTLSEFRRAEEKSRRLHTELPLLEKAAAGAQSAIWWLSAAGWGIGILASGVMAWYGIRRDALLLLFAAFAVGGFIWIYRNQIFKARRSELQYHQLQMEEIKLLSLRLESTLNSYAELAAEAMAPLSETPVADETLLGAVDRFFMALFDEEKRREALRRSKDHLNEKERAEQSARRLLETARAALETILEKLSKEKESWLKWLESRGLSDALSPATALDALNALEQVVSAAQHKKRLEAERIQMEEEISEYHSLARKPLAALGLIPDDSLPRVVHELADRLEESKGNQRERETLQRQIISLEEEKTAVDEKLRRTESEILSLLKTVSAPDEDTFRKTGRIEEKRRQLLSAARTAEQNMRRISGMADMADLRNSLLPLSLSTVKAETESVARTVQNLDEEQAMLYTRQAELKHSLEALSTSEDMERLRSEEEKLLADLKEKATAWSRFALADHLIYQAREIFEKKHQPHIIQDAGNIFSRMTGGRYTGVVSPLGENTIFAVSRTGERIPPEALSRGTAEQLYLSVRFSFIRHQARNSDPLPIIMDDILVNFDPVRARKAAEAIVGLSSSHQVLFFTCHPETTAMFQDIDPQIPIYRLDRGKIVAPEKHPVSEKN